MRTHSKTLLFLAPAIMGVTLVLGIAGSARPAAAVPPSTPATTTATTGTATVVAPASPATPAPPETPASPSGASTSNGQVTVNLGNSLSKPSSSITILIALTLLSVAPALLIMLTSFTRIIIVLSLTRNALGLQAVPPNQVLAGLALFISLFIMSPVITQINHDAVQPYIHGHITEQQAYDAGVKPLHTWMMKQTRTSDLALFEGPTKPASADKVPMTQLVPAFIISELKTAFIIGFVIFIPFLVIDLIVSASLMSMGMMMLPPVLVSLPFKLLLFVLVDGWALIVKSLITSFH